MFTQRMIVGVEMPDAHPWTIEQLSDPTQAAIRQAFELAVVTEAAIELVTVLPDAGLFRFGSADDMAQQQQQDRAAAEALLQHIQYSYRTKFPVSGAVSCTVTTGLAWQQLLQVAGSDRGNLILCGTREVDTVSRWLFGTTGLKLLRYAPCPVWLVRPQDDRSPGLDVLAATDLSDIGLEVVEAGIAVGQNLSSRLTVLHVVDNDLDRHMARTGVPEEELLKFREEQREDALLQLKEQLSVTDYRTVELGVQLQVAEGAADGCILSAIDDLNIDLLVLATSGRSGLPGMLFGTTAERLLPDIPCSVLLIKPADFACPLDL